jgi:hypothetical protein
MNEDLTRKIVAWAAETAKCAVELPSKQAREAYLEERRRDLAEGAAAEGAAPHDAAILADTCIDAARRILSELLAQRASAYSGHA